MQNKSFLQKRGKAAVSVFIGIFILFFICKAYAQTELFYIDERKKATIQKRQKQKLNTKDLKSKNNLTPQEREGQILAEQLEIITGAEETEYYIAKGDTVYVSFQDKDHLQAAHYKVSESGEIFLPLIGPTYVLGLNRKEARSLINEKLSEYIRYPNVGIKINDAGEFLILGAVGVPGVYKLTSELHILEAILYSGYLEDKAKLSNVIVIRGSYENPQPIKLNLKKMIKKGDRTDNLLVKPGDIIYVPSTFISTIEEMKNTVLDLVTDWYTLGGTVPFKNP